MSIVGRTAKISFKDQVSGKLEETATGGTRFIYQEGWKEPIACSLPLSKREHEWRTGLHPFFQHLGAEGWLRERQARVAHVEEQDDFGLLLRYGADCIGAVGVLPTSNEPPPAFIANEITQPGRTVSGVQRKVLAVRDEAASAYRSAETTSPAPYIAKLNSADQHTLVRNEFTSLRWVRALLGAKEVTQFQTGRLSDLNETALIVTRFDRTPDGQKLRAEDFAQILSKPRGTDYTGKYEASYEEVAEAIRAHSARPEIDLARFFARLVAFVLVCNGDAHLKNFTLLERPEGLRLSPVYDVLNVAVYANDGVSQQFALAIAGQKLNLEELTKPLLTEFALRVGLSKAAVDGTFRTLKTKARQARKLLPAPDDEGRDPFGARYSETVRNACLRLLEE